MLPEHPFIDDLPAYALGALDSDSSAALEAHLQTCETCRTELAAYRAISDSLLMATPPQRPPAALRQKLKGRLPGQPKTSRPWWNLSFPQMGMALAVILLLTLNISTFIQIQALQRQQAQLATRLETGRMALAMLAYPETKSVLINANNVAGTVLLDEERNLAVILAWELPQLPASQTYQIWLIDGQGKRTSGGVFTAGVDSPFTSTSVLVPGDLTGFTGLGVTVEPAGGSPQPTGERVFKVDF